MTILDHDIHWKTTDHYALGYVIRLQSVKDSLWFQLRSGPSDPRWLHADERRGAVAVSDGCRSKFSAFAGLDRVG